MTQRDHYLRGLLAFALASATPAAADETRYYPQEARQAEIEGLVKLKCTVKSKTGELKDCFVISEVPTGFDFGEAAMKMVPMFKMRPRDDLDISEESSVTIPIRFKLPTDSSAVEHNDRLP